jgi:WD40 repeat protein
VYFPPGSKELISAGDLGLRYWEATTGKELKALFNHKKRVTWGTASPDGTLLATGGFDGTIQIRGTRTGELCHTLAIEEQCMPVMAFSPDCQLLVSRARYGNNRGLQLWDVPRGKEILRFYGCTGNQDLAFLPDNSTIVELMCSVDLFEARTGKLLRSLPEIRWGAEETTNMVLSPDGRFLANGTTDLRATVWPVGLWEMESGKAIAQLMGHSRLAKVVTISRDGRILASGSIDKTVRLWDVVTGKELHCFEGHEDTVTAIAFSPDAKLLATGGRDGTIFIWDVAEWTKPRPLPRSELSENDLEALWYDLHLANARQAYHAIWKFVGAREVSVPFLEKRLKSEPFSQERVDQLIKQLDDNRFLAREEASHELEKLGAKVVPALRAELERDCSTEVRRRIDPLLGRLAKHGPGQSVPQYEVVRGIQALEYIATPEAYRALRALASGDPQQRVANEATMSLARLMKAKSNPP